MCRKACLRQLERRWLDTSTCINSGMIAEPAGKQNSRRSSSDNAGPFLGGEEGGRGGTGQGKGRLRASWQMRHPGGGGSLGAVIRPQPKPWPMWSEFRPLWKVLACTCNFAGTDMSSPIGLM